MISRAQRHHRLHADHLGGVVRKRRRAVQHDPGTHDVAADFARSARSPAELAIERGYGSPLHAASNAATCSLMPSSSSARARCVMRRSAATESQCVRRSTSAGTSPARTPSRFIPVLILRNTSIGRSRCALLEHRHLIGVMDDRREPLGCEFGQLVGREKPLEQQDPPRVVRSAQRERGVELDDRESVGVRERREYAREAVAVGVGLDHREHLRLRRARRAPARDSRAARRG